MTTLTRTLLLATIAGAATLIGSSACARQADETELIKQRELIEKRDAKLAEDWIQQAPWTTDYDQARADAAGSGKLIFAYFTRSYAP